MARSLNEWIGKTDDTPVPPRIRVRNFIEFGGICQACGLLIGGKRWITDHRIAIINGGRNCESNLRPIHEVCDKTKTAEDVAEKSLVYRKVAKNLGVKRRKGRPIPGSKASGLKKSLDGTVTKR